MQKDSAMPKLVEEKLQELGFNSDFYSILREKEDAWCIVFEDSKWKIFDLERAKRTNVVEFDDKGLAFFHFLGVVTLFSK